MGLLHPSDEKKGKLVLSAPGSQITINLLDSLQRPVHATFSDVDGDGEEDVLVSEFGNTTGSLSWFKNLGSGQI